jgi:hypothetical protein
LITVVNLIAKHIREHSNLSDEAILEEIYTSDTYRLIENESNGLWSESPCYLAELIMTEANEGNVDIRL